MERTFLADLSAGNHLRLISNNRSYYDSHCLGCNNHTYRWIKKENIHEESICSITLPGSAEQRSGFSMGVVLRPVFRRNRIRIRLRLQRTLKLSGIRLRLDVRIPELRNRIAGRVYDRFSRYRLLCTLCPKHRVLPFHGSGFRVLPCDRAKHGKLYPPLYHHIHAGNKRIRFFFFDGMVSGRRHHLRPGVLPGWTHADRIELL